MRLLGAFVLAIIIATFPANAESWSMPHQSFGQSSELDDNGRGQEPNPGGAM